MLYEKYQPMIFKFGITHDAHFRWHAQGFGYKDSVEKFEHMKVIYLSNNPHGPAFLEAALIAHFGCCLNMLNTFYNLFNIVFV